MSWMADHPGLPSMGQSVSKRIIERSLLYNKVQRVHLSIYSEERQALFMRGIPLEGQRA